jgi:hypothetical protein
VQRILTAIALALVAFAPLTHAAQPDDPVHLTSILRALHADRCANSIANANRRIVISDRPFVLGLNEKTRKPIVMFGIAMLPRAPATTLWPEVELCPGWRVVKHEILEPALIDRQGRPRGRGVLESAFDGAYSYETITLPAYSADAKRAVVYFEHHCPLCGEGVYYELTLTDAGWKVSGEELRWIS